MPALSSEYFLVSISCARDSKYYSRVPYVDMVPKFKYMWIIIFASARLKHKKLARLEKESRRERPMHSFRNSQWLVFEIISTVSYRPLLQHLLVEVCQNLLNCHITRIFQPRERIETSACVRSLSVSQRRTERSKNSCLRSWFSANTWNQSIVSYSSGWPLLQVSKSNRSRLVFFVGFLHIYLRAMHLAGQPKIITILSYKLCCSTILT